MGAGIGNVELGYFDSRDDRAGDDPTVRNSELQLFLGEKEEMFLVNYRIITTFISPCAMDSDKGGILHGRVLYRTMGIRAKATFVEIVQAHHRCYS